MTVTLKVGRRLEPGYRWARPFDSTVVQPEPDRMLKTYLPGLSLGIFLCAAMALSPSLAVSEPPRPGETAVAQVDPLSPVFVNPYIEKDVQETHPLSPANDSERAYARLEVEPQTAGEPFPVVRTRFREPVDRGDHDAATSPAMFPPRWDGPPG